MKHRTDQEIVEVLAQARKERAEVEAEIKKLEEHRRALKAQITRLVHDQIVRAREAKNV